MRELASDANIVIVNHHLFFADLNVRKNEFGRVVPDYSAVVFDEAHLLEDIASEYFGFQVSNFQIDEIVRDAQNLPITDIGLNRDITKICGKIIGFADHFWASFDNGRGNDGRFPLEPNQFARKLTSGEIHATPAGEAYFHLEGALKQLETMLDKKAEESPEIESIVRRARQVIFDLGFVISQSEKNYVYWMERRGRGVYLRSSPIDMSLLMQEKVFDRVETAVLTSATLSSSGKFDFIRNRLGLGEEKTDTLLAPSSFDYQKQALLYLPTGMPDPRSHEFTSFAANEIVNILKATHGRAFVLSTSISAMNALYEMVSLRVDYPCFVQGSASKAGIIEKFRSTPNAVLFATSSFWQGVDVQGEQLSCVIIDKLPFAVPTDPLVAARTRFIDESGGKSFFDYSVPQAIISLKQGVGRLIRSTTDRGVIAILDPRLRTKAYGRDFVNSLPKCRITGNLSDIKNVIDS
jgi:ATP-dependent DNA helicase DinG